MDRIAHTYITNQILNLIKKSYEGNIDAFAHANKNLDEFISNSNQGIIITHFPTITNEHYINIVEEIYNLYKNNNQLVEITNKPKNLILDKVNGFVDTLILAFIAGTAIGVILLNIYSKIIENI